MKVKYQYMAIILMLHLLKLVNLQGFIIVNNENQRNREAAISSPEVTDLNDNKQGSGGLSFESHEKLYDVAKNISHSKGIYRDSENKENPDDQREVRRSILRKIAVESESDVIKNIFDRFKIAENKVLLLDQLEYMVHQYEVAIHFAQIGGIDILMPFLFSPDDEIVSSVASVLGAAMQSNPTVQELAMKKKICENLMKLLSHKSPIVLSRVIFALASFLRNVPDAQDEFFAINGISKLANLLKQHKISTSTKLKIISLFSDISVEMQTSEFDPGTTHQEKMSRRARIFTQEMQMYICEMVPSFLYLEDFDSHEKIVSAMLSLKYICLNEFQDEDIVDRLEYLMVLYDPTRNVSTPIYPIIDEDLKWDFAFNIISLLDTISSEYENQIDTYTNIPKGRNDEL